MERDLIIKLGMDRSKATAAGQAFVAEAKAMEGKILSDAEVSERARVELVRNSNRQRIDEARKSMEAEAQAANKSAETQRSAIGRVIDAIRRRTQEGRAGLNVMDEAANKLTSSLSGLAAGALSIGSVTAAARSYLGVMGEAAQVSQKQLDNLLATKDLIREIAMITGSKEGPSDREVQKFMDVRKASGLSNQEAKENVLEFEGAGAAAKGKNISESEYERAKVFQSKFAATAGGGSGAAGTFGKLAGVLLGLNHYDKAEDLLASETQFNRILSKGVGDNPTLIKQSAAVAGAYIKEHGPGIVKDERELAAMTSTASRINPEQAAEIMKSTTRVFRGFDEKWSPLLKKANITEKDTYSEASEKLFSHLEQVEKSGRAVDAYLAEEGVDQHGATHTMSMYRYKKLLKDTLIEEGVRAPDQESAARGIVPGKRMTGDEAVEELNHKYSSDISLQIKKKQAEVDEAKMMNTVHLQPGRLLDLEAERRFELRGEGASSPSAQAEDLTTGKMASGFGLMLPNGMTQQEFGRKIRMEQEKKKIADERGVKLPNRPNDTSLLGGYTFDYLNWMNSGLADQEYSAAAFEIQMGGGRKPWLARPPGAAPAAEGEGPKAPPAAGTPVASLTGGEGGGEPGAPLPAESLPSMGWRTAVSASMVGAMPGEDDAGAARRAPLGPGGPRAIEDGGMSSGGAGSGMGGGKVEKLLEELLAEMKRGNEQKGRQGNPPISGRPPVQTR